MHGQTNNKIYSFFWVIPRRLNFTRRHINFRRRGVTKNEEYYITRACFYLKLRISFYISTTIRLEHILIKRQAGDATYETSLCINDYVFILNFLPVF